MTPQKAAAKLPPLTDQQAVKVAALLSLPKVNGDPVQNPAPANFTARQIVSSLTAYNSLTVSADEAERQLRRVYPDHRLPGTAARAQSQAGRCCQRCGRQLLARQKRWCSNVCRYTRTLPSAGEVLAECRAAYDRVCEEAAE